ncbi:uncharacterized protein MONOS_8470 [Monocercomonoides exilis]|uniref:uncharacterized protein n=1 Tax=Monocercomonoides exilis TaxID=2049356 RepID=UPI00355AC581|nr:hypothetical protein MONOS_8470 [Monocercomonoides exilis]|eukprot:MONOS_8470.1-p1 / transcript=MONOS_8470.1 / gene=MONOS_8470 / organism=Monocercomonoides_exilis_PA203 / gene_product=unspecified product / transcript_product=unspecified product / location=Mono_scaffold00320:31576-32232(+) / protein_length=219 / sequence_SO=supercontig / SO=protein_coding / is_pseudo=false
MYHRAFSIEDSRLMPPEDSYSKVLCKHPKFVDHSCDELSLQSSFRSASTKSDLKFDDSTKLKKSFCNSTRCNTFKGTSHLYCSPKAVELTLTPAYLRNKTSPLSFKESMGAQKQRNADFPISRKSRYESSLFLKGMKDVSSQKEIKNSKVMMDPFSLSMKESEEVPEFSSYMLLSSSLPSSSISQINPRIKFSDPRQYSTPGPGDYNPVFSASSYSRK